MKLTRVLHSCVAAALAVAFVGGASASTALAGSGAATPDAPDRPEVAVIGMGGTIAGIADSRVGFETYEPGKLRIARLVKDLGPEIDKLAEISGKDFAQKPSGELTIADYHAVSRLVDTTVRTEDAVVITSGTAGLEELAYFLDLTVRSPKPVVVTAAMRPWNVIGSDGPPNLYNAVRLAASEKTRCFGTTVLTNDQIFPARDVTKTDTLRVNTFQTREFGHLGVVDERKIRIQRAPSRVTSCGDHASWQTPFDLRRTPPEALPRVEIVTSYTDAGPESVRAFTDAGVKGLVFAGTPSPAQLEAAMDAAKEGVVLVASNGYGAGAVHVDPGMGVIGAEDLAAKKARILLQLALSQTEEVGQIGAWFARYGAAEF